MKDWIKRIITMIIFGAFLCYLGYFLVTGQEITNPEYENLNTIFYFILIITCIYIVGLYGIYPIHIKFSRATLFFVGIALIIISQTILANDGTEGIIIGDLFSVLGVATLLLFPTNVLTTDKVKKKSSEKNQVIIEV
ncbi:MAG: hypothetical protein LBI53_02780 [Candidatus Peribacteria bacterium]|jgi:hypothetical protein|nr:hypothetical protein [Candidatus Peribacteria bacterium]